MPCGYFSPQPLIRTDAPVGETVKLFPQRHTHESMNSSRERNFAGLLW